MSSGKRYSFDQTGCPEEDQDGGYVESSDYDAIAAECQRLREALEEIARSETYVGDIARTALAGGKEGE